MFLLNLVKQRITGKILSIISLIFIMMLVLMNILAMKFTSQTGEQVLDFVLGYSPAKAYQIISNYGGVGRGIYLKLLGLDFIFPIIYMLFGVCLLSYLLQKYFNNNKWLTIIITLPVVGMICDWLENIMIIKMLIAFPNQLDMTANLGSLLTTIKFVCTGGTLVVALILVISGGLLIKIISTQVKSKD